MINEVLRDLRKSNKMTQGDLANYLNISIQKVSHYESGYNSVPVEVLIKYADFFDVSLDYIAGRTDNPQGKMFECVPKKWTQNKEISDFFDACFSPSSPIFEKLKSEFLSAIKEGYN